MLPRWTRSTASSTNDTLGFARRTGFLSNAAPASAKSSCRAMRVVMSVGAESSRRQAFSSRAERTGSERVCTGDVPRARVRGSNPNPARDDGGHHAGDDWDEERAYFYRRQRLGALYTWLAVMGNGRKVIPCITFKGTSFNPSHVDITGRPPAPRRVPLSRRSVWPTAAGVGTFRTARRTEWTKTAGMTIGNASCGCGKTGRVAWGQACLASNRACWCSTTTSATAITRSRGA